MYKIYLVTIAAVSTINGFTIVNEISNGGLVLIGYSEVKNRLEHPHKIVCAIEFKKKDERREAPQAPKNVFDTVTKIYEAAGELNKGGYVSLAYFSPKSEFAKQYAKGKVKLEELSYDAIRKEASHSARFFKPSFGSIENLNDSTTIILLLSPDGEPTRFVLKVPEKIELRSSKERKKSAEKEDIGKPEVQTDQDWDEFAINREQIARTRSTGIGGKQQAEAAYQQRAAAIERAKAESRAANE